MVATQLDTVRRAISPDVERFGRGRTLEQLLQLGRELEQVHLRTGLFAMNSESASNSALIAAIVRAVNTASATFALLHECILDSVVADPTLELRALEQRARVNVAVMQLQELAASAPQVTAPLWPTRAFRSVHDVNGRILARITCLDFGVLDEIRAGERHWSAAQVREMLLRLEVIDLALTEIGRDPDLVCFFVAGASVEPARFRNACRKLAMIFDVALGPAESWRDRATSPRPGR